MDVQGRLIEVLSGKPFDRFLQERIFAPLNMADTGFYVPAGKKHRLAKLYTPTKAGGIEAMPICATPDECLVKFCNAAPSWSAKTRYGFRALWIRGLRAKSFSW